MLEKEQLRAIRAVNLRMGLICDRVKPVGMGIIRNPGTYKPVEMEVGNKQEANKKALVIYQRELFTLLYQSDCNNQDKEYDSANQSNG